MEKNKIYCRYHKRAIAEMKDTVRYCKFRNERREEMKIEEQKRTENINQHYEM